VRGCRHSKSSARAVHGISGTVLKNDSFTEPFCIKLAGRIFSGFLFYSFPYMKSEILLVVSTVLWDVTACRLVERYILYFVVIHPDVL
jgi:hypothetical protein